MINLIREFVSFLKFRKSIKYIQLTNNMKVRLTNYDKEVERELDNLVLSKLHEQNMKGELSRELLLGAELALSTRLWLIQPYIK